VLFAVAGQSDDTHGAGVTTSSSSKPTGSEPLPVILEPPLLVPGEFRIRAPVFRDPQQLPDDSAGSGEIHGPESETENTGFPEREIRMADEGPTAPDDEWAWKYDAHGNRIWYRKSGSGDVIAAAAALPEGHRAGTVRFATRPPPHRGAAVPVRPPTRRPHGYWMVDDRGAYLWYRFVATGQYVRDPSVDGMDRDSISPDDQPTSREKLSWSGVGR